MYSLFKPYWRILAAAMLALPILTALFSPPEADAQSGKTINLQIIVDQSGSMAAATDTGPLRIDAAKTVLNEVIAQIPEQEGVNVGLRVYGHLGNNQPEGQAESCVSSDLLVPMQGVDKTALTAQVNALQPIGWTPLGYALQQAQADFIEPASDSVVNAIIMVTDGLETCGADPAAIASELKNSPAGVTTHVIGFGTTQEELAILQGITQASGGQLLDSANAGQLISSLFTILEDLEVVEVSGTGANRTSPIALGRTGQVGDYDVTVISAAPAAQPTGTTGGYDFTVRVSVTYRGSTQGNPEDDLRFTSAGDLGISYSIPNDQCSGTSAELSNRGNLFEGGSAEFSVCWLVAANDVDTLQMAVSSSRGNSPSRVWFALNRNTLIDSGDDAKRAPVFEIVARDIEFLPDTLTIPAYTDVVLAVYNEGFLHHNIAIDGLGIESPPASNGEYAEVLVNLPPGTYTFRCTIAGHTEAGQTGTLIVEDSSGNGTDASQSTVTNTDSSSKQSLKYVEVAASDGMWFSPDTMTISANTDVTVVLHNDGFLQHNFTIQGHDIESPLTNNGESVDVIVNLPPGAYSFECSVPGHAPAGQTGTLIVQ